MMKKAVLLILWTFGLCLGAWGQETWEGSAAMSRYGEFPTQGYYGASNSFQRNTEVVVENLTNGKSVNLIIVDRLKDAGLFILLSREAAAAIDITQDEVTQVRVRLAADVSSSGILRYTGDAALNADPDLNPAAGLGDVTEYQEEATAVESDLRNDKAVESSDLSTAATPEPETPEVAEEAIPGQGEQLPSITLLPEVREEPEVTHLEGTPLAEALEVPEELKTFELPQEKNGQVAETDDKTKQPEQVSPELNGEQPEAISSDLKTGPPSPVADLHEQPALDEGSALPDERPAPPEVVEEQLSTAIPDDTVLDLTEELHIDEEPEVVEAKPETGPDTTDSAPDSVEYILEPAGPKPPETGEEAVDEGSLVQESKNSTALVRDFNTDLEKNKNYVQIAVYSNLNAAQSVINTFSRFFPMDIYASETSGKKLYKVLLGPFNKDERGAVLHFFRTQGYKDSFMRREQ